jgi:hypothetical protein
MRRRQRYSGRPAVAVLAVATSVFLALALVASAVAEDGTAGIPLPPPPPPPSGSGESDGGTGSTTGYPDASPGQAENLFTGNFSGIVDSLASDPPELAGQHPVFLNDHTAVITQGGAGSIAGDIAAILDPTLDRESIDAAAAQSALDDLLNQQHTEGGAAPQLVSSVLPLRASSGSGPAPVDLSLDHEGGVYVPDNPLVDVRLPDDLSGDIAIGEDGVKLAVGESETANADLITDEGLFYADAAPATDIVMAPISTGLETFYQLRAPESPDRFRISFTMPDDAELTATGDGRATVVRGSDTLAVVYPPAAQDAAGNPVDVTMSVDGDALVLDVPHSDPGIRYPISVDPVIDSYTWSSNGQGAFADWVANQTTGSPYMLRTTCITNINCQNGTAPPGLYVEVPANSAVTNTSSGAWQYAVPHDPWTTAYISALNLGPLNFTPRSDTNVNPFMFAGIFADNSSSYLATAAQNTAASNLNWSLNPGTATSGKKAVFALWSWANRTVTAWRDAYLGGATITLGDTEAPQLTDVAHTGITFSQAADGAYYSNWIDSETPSITVTGVDNGLGVKTFTLPDENGQPQTVDAVTGGCTGASSSPCPQHPASKTATYNTAGMYNGVNVFGVGATDALGKTAARTFAVRVDQEEPKISGVTGGLATSPSGDPYRLQLTATDGDASDPDFWQSGVKEITEYVNGDPVYTTPAQTCTALAGSCSMSLDHTISATAYEPNASGELHIGIGAADQLGNEAIISAWNVPIPDTTIDSGPSGYVNTTGPTFIYHSSRDNSTFQCKIDQGTFASCPASGYTPASPLANGSHTFHARLIPQGTLIPWPPLGHSPSMRAHRP